MSPLISIIIPVFNCEQYLEACVASVLAQSYTYFDLILIDGGGQDRSGAMCDALARTDARIRVLHKSNEGVSVARNKGIDMAKGTWLCFIDSDDIITPDYLQKLVALQAEQPAAELLMCNITDVYPDGNAAKRNIANVYPDGTAAKRKLPASLSGNFRQDYAYLHSLLIGPVVKLYRKDIIIKNNILFPQGISCGEDELFNFQYYRFVNNYAFVDEGLYYYYHRENASLSQTLSEKIYQGMLHKLAEEQTFYTSCKIAYAEQILNTSALAVALHFYKLNPDDTYTDFCARLQELLPFIAVNAEPVDEAQRYILELIQTQQYPKLYQYAGADKHYLN